MSDSGRYKVLKEAKREGHEINFSNSHCITIDIDDKKDIKMAFQHIRMLTGIEFREYITIDKVCITRSKSKKGYHIYIRTKTKLDVYQRLLIAACCGSDRKREMLNLMDHYESGDEGFLIEASPEVFVDPDFVTDWKSLPKGVR